MKRLILLITGLIFCSCLTACDEFNQSSGSYFNNFEAEGTDHTYKVSGDASVEDSVRIVYAAPDENTKINLKGELESITGSVQVVYVDPNGDETIVADSKDNNKANNKGTMKIDTNVYLEKGIGRIEFKGSHTTFKFDLHLKNSDGTKLDFVGTDLEQLKKDMEQDKAQVQTEKADGTEKTDNVEKTDSTEKTDNVEKTDSTEKTDGTKKTDETADTLPGDNQLPQKATVTCNDGDNSCTVLSVKADGKTKVKVQVRMKVTERNRGKSTKFKGFALSFKTESGETVDAGTYHTDVFASDGYEEIESFSSELELPAGINELILDNNGGTNYKLKLDVKVDKAE